MNTNGPIVIVGHTPFAGRFAVRLLRQGLPVLWLKHRHYPSKMNWHGISFDASPPLFRRTPEKRETARPLGVIWDANRIDLSPRSIATDLRREFSEPLSRWTAPDHILTTHPARQLQKALGLYVSHQASHSSVSPWLPFMLNRADQWIPASIADELRGLEGDVVRRGGTVMETGISDLIVRKRKLWGVLLSNYLGPVPARHVFLMDHLESLKHVPALKSLAKSSPSIARRFSFSFVIRESDLPEGFSGEAILLSNPDEPTWGANALFLFLHEARADGHRVITARFDLPFRGQPQTQNLCEETMRVSLSRLEAHLFPYLSRTLEDLFPQLENASRYLKLPAEEHAIQLSLSSLPAHPLQIGPSSTWFGPEAFGRAGWFASEDAFLYAALEQKLGYRSFQAKEVRA